MPSLPEKPTLTDLQHYVVELERERGFSNDDVLKKCLLLGEEIGELFKAVRKQQRFGVDMRSKIGEVGGELADVLIYLCSIANRFDLSLETEFRKKEEINHGRKWE